MNKNYNWSSKELLIAEDEYPVYFLLETILEPTGIKITWARTGQEAVDIYKSGRSFDAILLDIRMPGMDGIETFKELRTAGAEIPILAQTAYSMSDEADELEKIGFNGYISKPFVQTEILNLLDKFLNQEN